MIKRISGLVWSAILLSQAILVTPLLAAPVPLRPLNSTQVPPQFGLDPQLWQNPSGGKGDLQRLLKAVDHSLGYIDTAAAQAAYQRYSVPAITQDRVRRSLLRFRTLVRSAKSADALSEAVQREFEVYQSVGKDGNGTVDFTGYYEATYKASLVETAQYRYPLYGVPADFSTWPQPQPTRLQLEGADGLQGHRGRLRGQALVWLGDRLDAYLAQVQGSARLTLPNGKIMTVGVAAKTNYPYVSLGKELVKAGKIRQEDLTLPVLNQYFQTYPAELDQYIPRNNRFVFFTQTYGAPAMGNLGVPVTKERSIATDKSVMPPGALAVIQTRLPYRDAQQTLQFRNASHFVLDQDTGGAIKGPGRVDLFMGTGARAKENAGVVNTPGQLYYLMLKR
jgi:membrane-bound lytic murein transglycosylase A